MERCQRERKKDCLHIWSRADSLKVTEGDRLRDISSLGVKMADRWMAAGRKSLCASFTNLLALLKRTIHDSSLCRSVDYSSYCFFLFLFFFYRWVVDMWGCVIIQEMLICASKAFSKDLLYYLLALHRRCLITLLRDLFNIYASAMGPVVPHLLQAIPLS